MKLKTLRFDEFKRLLEGLDLKDDHKVMISEAPVYFDLTPNSNGHEIIGSLDTDSNRYGDSLQRIKNILMGEMIENWVKERMQEAGLDPKFENMIETLISRNFVGGSKEFEEFSKIKKFGLSSMSQQMKISIDDIMAPISSYFKSSFARSLIDLELPTRPSTGKLETFLCLITDYTKPPKGEGGDLYSNGKVVEVKIDYGKPGGEDVYQGGETSKTKVAKLLRYHEDKTKGWSKTAYDHFQPILKEAIDKNKSLSPNKEYINIDSLMRALSNYDLSFSKKEQNVFAKLAAEDLEYAHLALQIVSYGRAHNIHELILLSPKKDYLMKYIIKNDIKDAYNFVKQYVKNAFSWGDSNLKRQGLSMRLR